MDDFIQMFNKEMSVFGSDKIIPPKQRGVLSKWKGFKNLFHSSLGKKSGNGSFLPVGVFAWPRALTALVQGQKRPRGENCHALTDTFEW